MLRVLVLAPHPLLREGIRLSLRGSALEVVGEFADVGSAARSARAVRPDVCLVDAVVPGGGPAAVRAIVRARPPTAVIVLADRSSVVDLLDALDAGAVGCLDKDIRSARLPGVLRAAAAGEAIVPRRLVGPLAQGLRLHAAEPLGGSRGSLRLTRRELEVLDLMRAGLTTSAIAGRLVVSPGTVRSHVMSLMHKLRARDRAALVGGGRQSHA